MSLNPSEVADDMHHAAMWLIGPDMPGILERGSEFVARHRGNIEKNIADTFGEKAVVFMSITAPPEAIAEMQRDTPDLKRASGCNVIFEQMKRPTAPEGYQEALYGFDIVTDDASGLLAEIANLIAVCGMAIVGHTGERRVVPGPRPLIQSGQKFIVLLPHKFNQAGFRDKLTELVTKYHGVIISPLRPVPGLLWWW